MRMLRYSGGCSVWAPPGSNWSSGWSRADVADGVADFAGICPRYDGPRGRRRWRALALGTVRALGEAEVARVSCPEHGVVIERVPRTVHGSGFTKAFEEQVAGLAVECAKTGWRP